MEKPNNIIDINPLLKAEKIREFNEKFLAKLKAGSTQDKISAAQLENKTSPLDESKS
jgi:hypothetical protein